MIGLFLFKMLNCNYCISFSITLDLIDVGIGRPPGQMDPKAFVLQPFNKTARERVKPNYLIMFYY
jgi:peptidyl-tRNA hydrolase